MGNTARQLIGKPILGWKTGETKHKTHIRNTDKWTVQLVIDSARSYAPCNGMIDRI